MPAKPKVGSRPNEFKYGMALYGAAWPPGDHFFVCGGGGHGLVNRIVWAAYRNGRCTDQVGEYKLGAATPMRMALAPSGSALLLGMSDGGVRRFQLDLTGPSPRVIEVSAAFAERFAELAEEVTAMAFSGDGGLLAVGFASGAVKVVAYPTMKPLVAWRLSDGVKDLDFARDAGPGPRQGPMLATACEGGVCTLWDVATQSELCRLPLPRGMEKAQIARCRFSRTAPVLFVAINQPRGGCTVAAYGPPTSDLQRRRSGSLPGAAASAGGAAPSQQAAPQQQWVPLKRQEVDPGPNASMEISRSGRLLALGQSEGNLLVVDTQTLHVVRKEPQASMVFVTRVAFDDAGGRALAVGADANAFVLDMREGRAGGGGGGGCAGALLLLLLLLLALAAAGLAFLAHSRPDEFEDLRRRAGGAWEALLADERVAGGTALARSQLSKARARAEALAGRYGFARDEL